jgi:hypothetical protein
VTTPSTGDQLLSLLPALYRVADADNDGVLAELMGVLAGQVAVLSANLDQYYDDQFIETCADWVAPYIGDLIGYRPMYGVVPAVASPRADVANTIGNRRRKGTALMLEQLARDVTGWPAVEVEYFQLLVWAQYMNHIRPTAGATPDLRDHEALGFIGGPFDPIARTVDVRRITTAAGYHPTSNAVGGPGAGRYNIKNIGVYVWRVAAVPLNDVPGVSAAPDGLRFRIDSLDRDLPIYSAGSTVPEGTLVQFQQAPLPLGRRRLADHLADYYGPGASVELAIFDGTTTTPIDISQIRICDLSDTTSGAWAHQPAPPASGGSLYVLDPVLGRIYLSNALPAGSQLLVSYHYGEAVPCGAGGRDRGPDPTPATTTIATAKRGDGLQTALNTVAQGGVALIDDSWTYPGTPTVTAPALPSGGTVQPVTLRGTDFARPVVELNGPMQLQIGEGGEIVLDGLCITGGAVVVDGASDTQPRTLTLTDCTLVPGMGRNSDNTPTNPGAAALFVLHPFASVTLQRCIVGPIVAVQGAKITLTDCIVDAGATDAIAYTGRPVQPGQFPTVPSPADEQIGQGTTAGAQLSINTSTVIGAINAETLDISDSIVLADTPASWPAPVWSHRRQQDCIRFSWLPPTSRVGRRYQCQPDGSPPATPILTSTRFGDPGYCQLDVTTPGAILTGADNQSEMGVTHQLYVPQRGANLLIRLAEYLRFGLEAGYIYAS